MADELEVKNIKAFMMLLAIGVATGILMVVVENYLLTPVGL
ncbi:MAG TPA: hypothetical protein VGY31_03435 [Terriglobia bacterium]|nr:hypothetical protein [Terriglobia bacterium]